MIRIFLLLFSISFMGACKPSSSDSQGSAKAEEAATAHSKDETMLQLSAFLIADPQNQAEQEQNAIIDYAMNEMIPLERNDRGVFYRTLKEGDGELLQWGDYIKVHYKGYFLDGKVFDDTRVREQPMQFYIGNMIPGWNFGLQHIAPGGTIQLFVVSPLAYAEKGLPNAKGGMLVPPNTPLVFEVEVLERLKEAD